MSTTAPQRLSVDHEPVSDLTPVEVDAASLSSTAPEYLHEVKRELATSGHVPVSLAVRACFDEDCSISTQSEADRLRNHVRAASFLGAGRLVVDVDAVDDPEIVEPALESVAERARREGLRVEVTGAFELDD